MKVYQVPNGYESFEAVEAVFKNNLPEGFKIVESEAGGKMPMFTAGKKVGTIYIRQNSYNGIVVSLTSTDGTVNDNISIVDYVPSWIVRFLRGKVLGYATNLIFPAIYGSSTKIYDTVDGIVMKNLQANELDTSMGTTLKSMFSGKGLTEIKKSSINSIKEAVSDGVSDTVTDVIKDKVNEHIQNN